MWLTLEFGLHLPFGADCIGQGLEPLALKRVARVEVCVALDRERRIGQGERKDHRPSPAGLAAARRNASSMASAKSPFEWLSRCVPPQRGEDG